MVRNLIEGFRSTFVASLHYESDPLFRQQMGRLVKRDVYDVGVVGLAALILFLGAQIVVLGKVPVFSYDVLDHDAVTVLWDKIVMAICFGALLTIHPYLPDDRPAPGRFAVSLGAVIVVAAITLDDVGSGNVQFNPAYVTMVILFLSAAIPMRLTTLLLAVVAIIAAWGTSLTLLPYLFGLWAEPIYQSQVVFLVVIVILSIGISSLLYRVRFEEYQSRRQSERLSDELAESNRVLEKALMDLGAAQDRLVYAEKMASLGRFASGLAHEIRNPLNFVTNFSKLSADLVDETQGSLEAADVEDLRDNLRRIQEHAGRAERIVKSLITHTQLRSNSPSDVDINQLLTEQTSALSRRYDVQDGRHRQVGVSLELDPNVGVIKAYPGDLVHAFEHVLDNAFRATIDRALQSASDFQPEISVSTQSHADGVRVVIRDNGVGMSEEDLGMVFEPFFTTRAAGDGTGLGLSAAYSTIAERHGGHIAVESRVGEGSRFTIELKTSVSSPEGNPTG